MRQTSKTVVQIIPCFLTLAPCCFKLCCISSRTEGQARQELTRWYRRKASPPKEWARIRRRRRTLPLGTTTTAGAGRRGNLGNRSLSHSSRENFLISRTYLSIAGRLMVIRNRSWHEIHVRFLTHDWSRHSNIRSWHSSRRRRISGRRRNRSRRPSRWPRSGSSPSRFRSSATLSTAAITRNVTRMAGTMAKTIHRAIPDAVARGSAK